MEKLKADREAPSITYGGLEILLVNNDVFGYTRLVFKIIFLNLWFNLMKTYLQTENRMTAWVIWWKISMLWKWHEAFCMTF